MTDFQLEKHYVHRGGWIRAAILGANDGLLSTASLAIGVAAATSDRNSLVIAALAGLVAGAFAMAAGEYVSVSSQADIETADLKREAMELEKMPEVEMKELAKIYIKRGLKEETAMEVARQLHEFDALGAHARDELGINEITQARPMQAALASGASFIAGGILPTLVAFFLPMKNMVYEQYFFTLIFLVLLGAGGAKVGGSHFGKGILRIVLWGTIAMLMSALVGHLFGVNIA